MIIRLFTLSMLFALTGCGAITHSLADLKKGDSYPAAKTQLKQLTNRPIQIDLSHYQSVQSSKGRPLQRSDLAVAIAASGGGYRAANLTTGVLLGLEKLRFPQLQANMLQEVDYFSSTSGGGFAAGLYLTTLYKHLQKQPQQILSYAKKFYSGSKALKPKLRTDYADDLFFGSNRSINLEDRLSKDLLTIGPNRELLLGDIFIDKNNLNKQPTLPLWVTNSAIIQNSTLFQFAPDILSAYKIYQYVHRHRKSKLRRSNNSIYAYDMPAAVGMTASATFPYAVAGTTLWSKACDRTCYLQLFDGGLIDNLGIYTALEMLRQDKAKNKLLIIVDAYHENPQPFSQSRVPPKKFDLLQKVLSIGPDAFQRQMREFAPIVARNILCTPGTEQVLVAYLDLYHSPKAHTISTSLWLSEQDQDIMLNTGKRLVRQNKILTQQLPQMLRGIRVASCKKR